MSVTNVAKFIHIYLALLCTAYQ